MLRSILFLLEHNTPQTFTICMVMSLVRQLWFKEVFRGDEFCGYLTAQLLTQARVTKGTLIIVPRANPPSIHRRKRFVNVDLNRRFDQDYGQYYEDSLARLIKYLVSQSQGLIHLHEGSGFYNPTKIDDMHGPKRYGTIDCH